MIALGVVVQWGRPEKRSQLCGTQPDKGYPGRRCAKGASGPGRETDRGRVLSRPGNGGRVRYRGLSGEPASGVPHGRHGFVQRSLSDCWMALRLRGPNRVQWVCRCSALPAASHLVADVYGSDDHLDEAHVMRWAGRLRGGCGRMAKQRKIPILEKVFR